MRTRALLGKTAAATATNARDDYSSSSSAHWSEDTSMQHLLEVMSRMAGDRGLLEKLLLHGLR